MQIALNNAAFTRQQRLATALLVLAAITLFSSVVLGEAESAADSSQGVAAPAFTLPAISNESGQLSLADLRGQVVYVDFWASWCGPCRLSLPAIDGLYQDLAAQGFTALAVSIDIVEDDALDFLKRYPVSYPVVIDIDSAIPRLYSVEGMPSGYLIDRQGMIREVHVGYKKGDERRLRRSIEALLAEPF